MTVIIHLKRCCRCGQEKPATLEYFNLYNRALDGLRNPCRTCLGVPNRRIGKPLDIGIPGAVGIPLTKGHIATVDESDADLVNSYWHAKVRVGRNAIYAARNAQRDGKRTEEHMHRIVLSRVIGRDLLDGEFVDHIDGNGLNNRRENLRVATAYENRYNLPAISSNKTGYKGVYLRKENNKYISTITFESKRIYLGEFATPEEAYKAYCDAAKKYHGEFARVA